MNSSTSVMLSMISSSMATEAWRSASRNCHRFRIVMWCAVVSSVLYKCSLRSTVAALAIACCCYCSQIAAKRQWQGSGEVVRAWCSSRPRDQPIDRVTVDTSFDVGRCSGYTMLLPVHSAHVNAAAVAAYFCCGLEKYDAPMGWMRYWLVPSSDKYCRGSWGTVAGGRHTVTLTLTAEATEIC